MRRLRVGIFNDVHCSRPNGITTSVNALAAGLRRLGHEAWVIAPWHPGASEEPGVLRVPSLPYPFYGGHRVALPAGIRLPVRLDVIHTQTPNTLGWWGAHFARAQGVPHVTTFFTHFEAYAHYVPGLALLNGRTGLIERLLRRFYGRADTIIVPTEPVKALVRSYGIRRAVRVVPSGLDLDVLQAAATVPSPWPEGSRRLLSVGRLGQEKRLDVLLDALGRVRRSEDAHLVVIGEGTQQARLRETVRRLGLEAHVTLLGLVPYAAIGAYYRQAELFLSSSDTETQGLVLWEAQALGLPVVAVGALGTLEGVEHGRTGYLVPAGDAGMLAARTLELLRDEPLRRTLGSQARERISGQGPEHFARRVERVYVEAAGLAQSSK